MRTVTARRPLALGAATSLLWALGGGAAGAADVDADARVGQTTRVEASAVVGAGVTTPSVTVKKTTLGPVQDDGKVLPSQGLAAGAALRAAVELTARAASGADVGAQVVVQDGQPVRFTRDDEGCENLDVAFTAVVTVQPRLDGSVGGSTEDEVLLTADVTVAVVEDGAGTSATQRLEFAVPDVGQTQEVPVATGVQLCGVAAGVVGEVSATVTSTTEALLEGGGGTSP